MEEAEGKKKKLWIWILSAIAVLAAGVAGFAVIRFHNAHKYDEFLGKPEDAAKQCVFAVNSDEEEYLKEVSLYSYIKYRGNKVSEEAMELRQMYILNRMLEETGSLESFSKKTEETLWVMREYTFAEPEKIIQEKEDDIWFKSQGTATEERREDPYNLTSKLITEIKYDDLWIHLNRASNGKWYLTDLTSLPPYSWAGNEPMTEKNREYGTKLIESISDEEIYQMFSMASAAQLNNDGWQRGFQSPDELGWENFLNFYFGTLSEQEKAEAYDKGKGCYRFSGEQIGRRIWKYLGKDENDKDATVYGGFPHSSQLLCNYSTGDDPDIYEFEKQQLDGIKIYSTDHMKLARKEQMDNGMVLLEIDYYREEGKEGQDMMEIMENHQVLKVRAMEQGYRFLSYQIIEPEREPEGNRIPEEFVWKNWNQVMAALYSYERGTKEPEIRSNLLISDYEEIREFLRNLTLGETVPPDQVPQTAKLAASLSIEVESEEKNRVYDLYHVEAEGKSYMVIRTRERKLMAGSNGSGITISFNGVPLTQTVINQKELICRYEDGLLFKDMVQKMMER